MWSHEDFDLQLMKSVEAIMDVPCHEQFTQLKMELAVLGVEEFYDRYVWLYGFWDVPAEPAVMKKNLVAICALGGIECRWDNDSYSCELFNYALSGFTECIYPSSETESYSLELNTDLRLVSNACTSMAYTISGNDYIGFGNPLVVDTYELLQRLASNIQSVRKHHQRNLAPLQFINLCYRTARSEGPKIDFACSDAKWFYTRLLLGYTDYVYMGSECLTVDPGASEIDWDSELLLLEAQSRKIGDCNFLADFSDYMHNKTLVAENSGDEEKLILEHWDALLDESGLSVALQRSTARTV